MVSGIFFSISKGRYAAILNKDLLQISFKITKYRAF